MFQAEAKGEMSGKGVPMNSESGKCSVLLLAMFVLGILCSPTAFADLTVDDYSRAKGFYANKLAELVYRGSVAPNWIPDSEQFWYRAKTREGKQFVFVDPQRKERRPAFDHAKLASSLSKAAGAEYSADALPFDAFRYANDGHRISFTVGNDPWTCDLDNDYGCTKGDASSPAATPPKPSEVLSPNGKWAAFLREGNLWLSTTDTNEETPLTDDAEPNYDYAVGPDWLTFHPMIRNGSEPRPDIKWSGDSSKILTYRLDERQVRDISLVQNAPAPSDRKNHGARPIVYTYKLPGPGDDHLPMAEILVFDVKSKTRTTLGTPLFAPTFSPIGAWDVSWGTGSQFVLFINRSRDHKRITVSAADTTTGALRDFFTEEADTPVIQDVIGYKLWLFSDWKRIIWRSQRSGYQHLYLYDEDSCTALTSGQWNAAHIIRVDDENKWVYFLGRGREAGPILCQRDPYYVHLYRVRFDGTGLTLLTPEDATHAVQFSPSGDYFIDTYSRIDLPPVINLYQADGTRVMELEQADVDDLLATGWRYPERFVVKSHDGKSDLYGIMIKPSHFDPNKKYPVLDYHYGGVQGINVPKSFGPSWSGGLYPMVELGFIGIILDGTGTPGRSRVFHEMSYGDMGYAAGLIDQPAGIKQLAKRHSFIDIDRVGIYGGSGGGYSSTRAMFLYPDFFKVAVAWSGNHDQRLNHAMWYERYNGIFDGDDYADQANATHVEGLKGKLLLMHGDMDDNVPWACTVQLVTARIKANKDFDMLILPNRNHGIGADPYCERKRWDYFVTHLLGEQPPLHNHN